MEAVLIKLLNMSITASYLALAVMVLRLLLKKAPKWIFVALWAMVGLRLVMPISFESVLSAVPNPQPIPQTIVIDPVPQIHSGIPLLNSAVNPILETSFSPAEGASANPMQVFVKIASYIYLAGIAAMVGYTVFSYLRLRARVKEAVRKEGRIYICDRIPSPFILGLLSPKIYLPSGIAQEDIPYVVAHEKAHIRRLDHIWKPIGFALLAIYWFNPILWVAYILLCRDIETACDEKVLAQEGPGIKKAYSTALLNCSVSRRSIAACPLAFGEVGIRQRIKNVLNYKRPAFWIILIAVIAGIVVGICLLTDPVKEKSDQPPESTPSGQPDRPYTHWFTWESNENETPPDMTLSEYPGIRITANSGVISLYDSGGHTDVISGSPIENAFFFDATGDGKRDICATVYYGSGMIDRHIEIYDIAKGQRTTIEDRGNTDYRLCTRDYQLSVEARPYDEKGSAPFTYAYPLTQASFASSTWEAVKPYSLLHIQMYNSTSQHHAWENFSQYLDMDVEKGLTIYVWQMAEGAYSCVPIPDKNHILGTMELLNLPQMAHMDLIETKAILSTYGLSAANIRVCVVQMPNSSYIGRTDEAFVEDIRQKLGLKEAVPDGDTASGSIFYYSQVAATNWAEEDIFSQQIAFLAHQVTPLPVWHCATAEELEELSSALAMSLDLQCVKYGLPAALGVMLPYNEDFFRNYGLMVIYAPVYNESMEVSVDDVSWDENGEIRATVHWTASQTLAEEKSGRLIFIAIEKQFYDASHSFSATYSMRSQYISEEDSVFHGETNDFLTWFSSVNQHSGPDPFPLEEYPGMRLVYDGGAIYLEENGSKTPIIEGFCSSAFLMDIDGDGKRELCANLSVGNGRTSFLVDVYRIDTKTHYAIKNNSAGYQLIAFNSTLYIGKGNTSDLSMEFEPICRLNAETLAQYSAPSAYSPLYNFQLVNTQANPHTLWFDTAKMGTSRFYAPTVQLPEFPGLRMDATALSITLTTTLSSEQPLSFSVIDDFAMNIHNAYFCDVTGDGYPEICASVSYGSGWSDERIIIYDIYNGLRTSIQNRGVTDYCLGEKDGQLYIQSGPWVGSYDEIVTITTQVPFTPEALEYYSGSVWTAYPFTFREPQENTDYEVDLNGDGNPEVCAIIYFGSGVVDARVEIYDFANGKYATIEDRFATDYSLTSQTGILYLTSRDFQGQPALDVPFNILCPLDAAAVEKYSKNGWQPIEVPNVYENLDSSDGLTVCVWQMAEYSYSCVLLSGKDAYIDQFALMQLPTATLTQMRTLLAGYNIPDEQIRVVVIQMLHSSYIGRTDEAFVQELRHELGLTA